MKIEDLDQKLKVYEKNHDHMVLPEMFIIARLDGRGFTRLTKETMKYDSPYDEKFRDVMVNTASYLYECGFNISYIFTQSDEISVLLQLNDQTFHRKERKIISALAGEASAKLTHNLGHIACFDCRLFQFPNVDLIIEYFKWRSEDADKNALNSHCYWTLRKSGMHADEAFKTMEHLTDIEKSELLFKYGVNFTTIPNWQKRGIGIYKEKYQVKSISPFSNKEIVTIRHRIRMEFDLPTKDEYSQMIHTLVETRN